MVGQRRPHPPLLGCTYTFYLYRLQLKRELDEKRLREAEFEAKAQEAERQAKLAAQAEVAATIARMDAEERE